jgi:hypothetical protein
MNVATPRSHSGMTSIGKKIPDRNIIGNWIAPVIPVAASSVRANEAIT